jgi:tRNA (guanine-N7-)-methyltransferase
MSKLDQIPEPAVVHPVVVSSQIYEQPLNQRPIRSFALRGGHMSDAQKRAYAEGMPKWSIPFEAQVHAFAEDFPKPQPLIFEIGFGMGETTAHIAGELADRNFLAAEVYTSGVGSLLKLIDQNNLSNIRIMQHDAVEVLQSMIAAQSLAGVHIYFPDPWHKARHHKRRLIQQKFIDLVASRLHPDGYIHCATDWEPYAHQMLSVLSNEPQLRNTATQFADRPSYRPITKFERRGLRLGHGVWDLVFKKR